TLLHLIMGFLFPDSGTIDRAGLSPARIGFLPERAFYPPRASIGEYMHTLGRLAGLPRDSARQASEELLARLGLASELRRKLGTCSRGMLQRVGLAQALLADPPLLLLDEPTLSLDPGGQRFILDQIAALHAVGKTVILSSHQLEQVLRVCTHVAILNRGRMVRSGPMSDLLAPRRQLTIMTGGLPAAVVTALADTFPEIAIAGRQLTLAGAGVRRKNELLRLLIDAGVDVQQLREEHATLEEIYLGATGP
ncbi:MAG: ABC transporter ATP-binding protein, partial [Anaerolineae bacterium]